MNLHTFYCDVTEVLDTVDYVWNDGSVVFRTCEREKSRLVFQIVSTVKPVLNEPVMSDITHYPPLSTKLNFPCAKIVFKIISGIEPALKDPCIERHQT